jgi:hypothetical protein
MVNIEKIKMMVGLFIVNTLLSLVTFSIGSSNFKDSEKTIPFDLGHTLLPDLSNSVLLQMLIFALFNIPVVLGKDFQSEFMKYSILLIVIRHSIGILTITNPHKYKTCDKTYKIQYSILGHCYENSFNFAFANATLIFLLLIDYNFSSVFAGLFLAMSTIILLLLRSGTSVELLFTGLLIYAIKSLDIVNQLPSILQVTQ